MERSRARHVCRLRTLPGDFSFGSGRTNLVGVAMAERKRFSKWWRRLFVFECATCGKDERRAIDNVSLVKLRNLKDLCDLSKLKEPENWRFEICESEDVFRFGRKLVNAPAPAAG